ncbi:class I SAM-dependent methyltransferase [Candidatus Pacearchaeota archaeon]|nr:class I SAM-dependent methyltransferase [Candidatus Pacearchaeota archaeon]
MSFEEEVLSKDPNYPTYTRKYWGWLDSCAKKVSADIINITDIKNKKILGIGTGHGRIEAILGKNGAKIIGIDIDPRELFFAKKRMLYNNISNYSFIVADGGKLPFKSNIFDMAYANSVLEHTDNYQKFISEMLRVLEKGGFFYITGINALRIEKRLIIKLRHIFSKSNKKPSGYKIKHFFTPFKIKKELRGTDHFFWHEEPRYIKHPLKRIIEGVLAKFKILPYLRQELVVIGTKNSY